jgi:GNAT superfamily N-acetyltransferase
MSGMTAGACLVPPSTDLHASYLDALAEYHAEGTNLHLDAARLADPDVFAGFVAALRLEASDVGAALRAFAELGVLAYEGVDPAQAVPETVLWWVDASGYLGRIALRHRLTAALLVKGGNIGYEVRPSARRRGHASAMLAAALPVAAALGIEWARIDCDVANVASRRVIEKNGGLLEMQERGSLYFWVPTGPRRGRPAADVATRPAATADSAASSADAAPGSPATGTPPRGAWGGEDGPA